ncbi:MAG: RNA-directed DNA polymerase (Reverse transcriptase) [Clostridiales bacterium 38_11]|nr:MAG: RNA-directed DNA polymerase (Reverse transcriptase) [Clostridiales bacterium 38_11]
MTQRDLLKVIEEQIYPTLRDNNYAYEKGKSPHMCFREIARIVGDDHNWAVKIDIVDFFGSLDKKEILKNLQGRVDDDAYEAIEGIINAYLIIDGELITDYKGIPQGYNISPILSNVSMHSFDDYWSDNQDHAKMVRYSDDILILAKGRKKAMRSLRTSRQLLREMGLRYICDDSIDLRRNRIEYLGFQHYIDQSTGKFEQIPTEENIQRLMEMEGNDAAENERLKQIYAYYYGYNSFELPGPLTISQDLQLGNDHR